MDALWPMLLAMVAILATWAFAAFCLTGCGLWVLRIFGCAEPPAEAPPGNGIRRSHDADVAVRSGAQDQPAILGGLAGAKPLTAFWLGVCLAVAVLQIWHFLAPIDLRCVGLFAALGCAGWRMFGIEVAAQWAHVAQRRSALIACLVGTAIWLANRATGPSDNIDSGLYHWNSIRWSTDYPLVPGIGNLHIRLGSNQSSLLFAALFDQGPWRGKSNHLVNGLLLLALATQGWIGIDRMRRRWSPQDCFDALMLTPAVLMANHWWISSHSTDVAPATLTLFATSTWLHGRARQAGPLGIMLATALCMKITVAVFAGGLLAAVIYSMPRQRLGILAIALGALLGPWLVRGIFLSGYPLYPADWLAMPVDWRVPRDLLLAEKDHIQAFAKVHNEAFDSSKAVLWQSWLWLPIWLRLLEREIVLPALGVGCLAVTFLLRQLLGRRGRSPNWTLLAVVSAAIVFWFMTAPDTRFGFFLFWIAMGACLPAMPSPASVSGCRVLSLAIILLATGNVKKPYTEPAPTGFHPSATAVMTESCSRRHARVWKPATGRLCFDGPLPCTPYLDPGLECRNPANLAAGYRIIR